MERTKTCPQCKGTQKECGCGTGKCDHCVDGLIVDYPLGQPKFVPEYLTDADVHTLAEYWCDYTRADNLGEFIKRVALQGVIRYRELLAKEGGDPTSVGDLVNHEDLKCEDIARELNFQHKVRNG